METEKKKVQKRTIESREKIRQAALALFAKKGYYNTNTKEIAKTAGVSVGNFYNYYKDKGELYYSLAEEYTEGSAQALNTLSASMCESKNPRQDFADYTYAQMERADRSGLLFKDCGLIMQDDEKLRELFHVQTEKTVTIIENMLNGMHGVKLHASERVTARLLFRVVDQSTQDILRYKGTEYYEEYLNEFIRMVQVYLFGEEEEHV